MNMIINDEKLGSVLNQHRTPIYIYSKDLISDRIEEIKTAFNIKNFELLFATMANDNAEFIKVISENNVGACINSIKHLELVKQNGIDNSKIQFTSTGISKEDLEILYHNNISVNFDSFSQLEKWFSISPNLKAGVRINTSSLLTNSAISDRLGNNKNELPKIMQLAASYQGVINGLHIYIGTNFRRYEEMLPFLNAFFELARMIPTLEYVNIGGGMGIKYASSEELFDLNKYGLFVSNLVNNLNDYFGRSIKLVFEPGRGLAGPTGIYVTKVCDVKMLNGIKYVVVDGSIASFPRPFHHPESPHPTSVLFKENKYSGIDSVVVGRTTFSKDILSKCELPNNIEEDDYIVFEQAGAYCDSMRSKFLGQVEPLNIFV